MAGLPSTKSMKSESVHVRQIANGYIVQHSCCDEDGGYSSTEHYMPSEPDLGPFKKPKPAAPMDPVKLAARGGSRR